MPTPIRESVMAAFTSALSTALTGTTVERNRAMDVPIGSSKFVVVRDGPQFVAQDAVGEKLYTTTPAVEIYYRSTTPAAAVTALNGLYADTVKAAIADWTLGGKSFDVREGDITDVSVDPDAATPTASLSMTFEIDYQTKPLDPYTLGP